MKFGGAPGVDGGVVWFFARRSSGLSGRSGLSRRNGCVHFVHSVHSVHPVHFPVLADFCSFSDFAPSSETPLASSDKPTLTALMAFHTVPRDCDLSLLS